MNRDELRAADPGFRYLTEIATRETAVQRRLRAATKTLPRHRLQTSPEQGQLLFLLARMLRARRALEIGTFTGYSALAVALALPTDGRLVCCDISAEYTDFAKPFWEEAGIAGKIDLRIAPAVETLAALRRAGEDGSYDLAFIDADKPSYGTYYEQCLALLRPGGLVAIDNTLLRGRVADPSFTDFDTETVRALNLQMRDDSRIDFTLLPIADGMSLAWKR